MRPTLPKRVTTQQPDLLCGVDLRDVRSTTGRTRSFVRVLGASLPILAFSLDACRPLREHPIRAITESPPSASSKLPDAPPPLNPCGAKQVIPLAMNLSSYGNASRLYAEGVFDGKRASLLVDTGAPRSVKALLRPGEHFSLDAGLPYFESDAGLFTIGMAALPLGGLRVDPAETSSNGIPNVGYLGVDYFLTGSVELDLLEGRLVTYDGCLPSEASQWATLPFEVRMEAILIDARVASHAVRLHVDTGAAQTVVHGFKPPGPCHDEERTQDQYGEVHLVCAREDAVAFGDEQTTTRVDWIAKPTLAQRRIRASARQEDGLLGLLAFGRRRILFDAKAGVLRLGPRAAPNPK